MDSRSVALVLVVLSASSLAIALSSSCDLSNGQWLPEDSLPLYTGFECPHVRSTQNCARLGRVNTDFQKYRYQPEGCEVNRLTPEKLAELFRGKYVLMYGDSVSKNLASSVLCILNAAAPGKLPTFKDVVQDQTIVGYNISKYDIKFSAYFSNWLVNAESSPTMRANKLHLDEVDSSIAAYLPVADVFIFQATAWWSESICRFFIGGEHVKMSLADAYAKSLETLKQALAAAGFKGTAVMMGVSPTHYDVPGHPHLRCRGIHGPLNTSESEIVLAQSTHEAMFRDVQLRSLAGSPIKYIDILSMSSSRPDGHIQNWTKEGGAPPSSKDDCLHWCEGGVTDAWVEMLYHELSSSTQ